jgi:site-specific recombinase XerD
MPKNKKTATNPSHDQVDLLNLQTEFFTKLKNLGRSVNTLKNYKTDLDCFNSYLQKSQIKVDISKFSMPQVILYGTYLEAKYSSDNSRRRRVQALRIFFDYLVEQNIMSSNPVRKLPTSPKFLDIPRPTPFIDIKTLWEHLSDSALTKDNINRLIAKRNQISILLIFGGGLKVSDIAKLKRSKITLGSSKNEPARVMINHHKRDPYTVPLPAIFNEVYSDYITELEDLKRYSQIEFDEILFNANPYRILNGGLSPRGLEIIFEDLRKKLIITLTPKSLRQACIFKWLQDEVNDSLIKEWLGVAPSYSLKLYKEHVDKHLYSHEFLSEIYTCYKNRNY